jgi:hypothetical protein
VIVCLRRLKLDVCDDGDEERERWLEWWEEGCYIDNLFFLEPGFLPVPSRTKSRSSHVHMERGVVACA